MTGARGSALDRRDRAMAAACGAAALTVYVRTLAPGLTSDIDAAVFQLVGRVLGVAHNPGYPLYALLTWPIAQLPVGELAWRINLFSAAMGALAVALTAVTARRLGCGRIASAFAALGLGAGQVFWAQAVVAEVYTLHLVFVAALLQCALRWEATRRPAHFYAAVAWLAAGLGHHTTIAAFAPAIALHALLIDWRFALRLRTIAVAAGLCALGLLPYLYVLIRSRDPEAYVESRATTLGALAQVVLGGQFRERLFADPWTTIVTERVPDLGARVLRPDLTIAGLGLAAIGAAWLLWRRPATAALLLVPSALVIGFVAGYAVVDQPVFLLPVVLCLWLLAALGLDRVRTFVASPVAGPRRRAAIVAAGGVLALALPLGLAAAHGPLVDRSRDRAAARHVERLVAALPSRAAIASADFIADRMVQYQLLGRHAAAGRDITLAPRDAPSIAALAAAGVHVVAFPGAVERLRLAGLDFSAAPVPLVEGPIDRAIAELPRGSIVALAVPAGHAPALRPASRTAWPLLRLPPAFAGSAAADHAAVAVVGGDADGRAVTAPGGARIALGGGEAPWPGLAPIEAVAADGEAAIRAGGRDLLRTSDGAAVAIWSDAGALLRAFVLGPATGYQVPLEVDAMSAYPLIGAAASRDVPAGAAVDVTAEASSGSITAAVPAGGRLALDIADGGAVAPYVVTQDGAPRIDVRPAAGGAIGITIAARRDRPASIFVVFGAIPDRLVARLEGGTTPAAVRPAATAGLLRGPDRRSAVVRMTRDDQRLLLGAGWSEVETDDAGPYRWTTAREARLVLPPLPIAWHAVEVEAFGPAGRDGVTLAVRIDGVTLPPQPIHPGWQTRQWQLPADAAEVLRRRPVEARLVVEGAAAPRGIAVASLRFADAD